MSEIQLPDGWEWRTLQTLGKWSGGGTPSKSRIDFWEKGSILWVSPKDMKTKYLLDTEDKISTDAVHGSVAKLIAPPALLFVVRSGILRRILPVSITLKEVTVNQDIKSLSLSGHVTPEYLYYYTQCENRNILESCSKAGTTVESIEFNSLKHIKIPLAPLPVQQQIVAKIEELFSELDAGVQELQTALSRLKTYRQAVLHHYLNNPDWERVKIQDICNVVRGASPRPAGDPKYFGGVTPWITVGELTKDEGKYLVSVSTYVTDAGREKSRYINEGVLLLTNSGATLGVPKITQIGGCINDGSVALLGLNDITKNFLYWFLKSQTAKLRLINQGAAQPNLNTTIVKNIELRFPDLETQNQIVTKIEARLSEADALENTIRQELKRAENLRQIILKQAFAGKLIVDQTDASVALSSPLSETSLSVPGQIGQPSGQLNLF